MNFYEFGNGAVQMLNLLKSHALTCSEGIAASLKEEFSVSDFE